MCHVIDLVSIVNDVKKYSLFTENYFKIRTKNENNMKNQIVNL